MLEVAVELLFIWLFSFLTGIGLYELIVPTNFKQPYLLPLLAPALGLLQLTIICGYLVYFCIHVSEAPYIAGAFGLVTVIAGLGFKVIDLNEIGERLRGLRQISILRAAAFLGLLCVLLAPVLTANMATTPYRIGIDQVGYAESAQFLLEGGTLTTARSRLLTALQTRDLKKAEAQNIKSLNFETYVDSEFLLKALRWGFPGAVAALTTLTGSAHAFKIEFILLIFSYALLLGLAFKLLREHFSLSSGVAFAAVAALALNCNLLNVYYEGQLAQVFIAPFFLLILMLYLYGRVEPGPTDKSILKSVHFVKTTALFAFLSAGLFSSYNEAVLLLGAVIYLTMLLDFCFFQRTNRASMIFVAAGFLGGVVAVLPISAQWLTYTNANLQGLARGGFWQPHWASFAEILGFLDMYRQVGYTLVGRSPVNELVSVALSVFLAYLLVRFALKERSLDRSFWLAPVLIVAASYVGMRFIEQITNYSYMKIYTMLLPLIFCVVFAALCSNFRRRPAIARYAPYAAAFIIFVTGLLYINQYLSQSKHVTREMFAMYRFHETRRFDGYALMLPAEALQERIGQYMLAPLISMNWLNEGVVPKAIGAYGAKPVAIILTDTVGCRECLLRNEPDRIAYANASYTVFDTKMKVFQVCAGNPEMYSINARVEMWKNAPLSECDSSVLSKTLRSP